MMRSCVPTTVCRRTTSDDLHHRCLSRLKNFGRWSRRGDGRHNDYLKYSSLNTTLYVGFGAHRASTRLDSILTIIHGIIPKMTVRSILVQYKNHTMADPQQQQPPMVGAPSRVKEATSDIQVCIL
jgi:hypothetical protein